LDGRWDGFPPVRRGWGDTCSLGGPAAGANYQARGMSGVKTEVEETEAQDATAGLWPETAAV